MAAPVPFHDDVEVELPDEAAVIEDCISLMGQLMDKTFDLHRHAFSATHAKTHGVATGR